MPVRKNSSLTTFFVVILQNFKSNLQKHFSNSAPLNKSLAYSAVETAFSHIT
jgi:uncharacterized membrane-anchored protein YhcB (DUF1043 family)